MTKKSMIVMDSRERVIRAVEFDGPDRIPLHHFAYPGAIEKFGLGVLAEICDKYPSDLAFIGCSDEQAPLMNERGRFQDRWGTVWVNLVSGLAGQPKEYPLNTWGHLENYDFPDPFSPEFWLPETEDAWGYGGKIGRSSYKSKYIVAGGTYPNTNLCIFERLWFLRGLENTLIDLIRGRKEIKLLRDKILEFNLQIIGRWVELDISDCVYFSDDLGNQKGPMFSPKIWREFVRPAYEEMFKKVHKAGKHVFYHSDGEIHEIIPDLISMGVDIFYPQLQAIPLSSWERVCGGKMCVIGVDTQFVLPRGSSNEVQEYIYEEINALASYDGGLIADVEISPEIPLVNIKKAFETFWKYSRYPRRIEDMAVSR